MTTPSITTEATSVRPSIHRSAGSGALTLDHLREYNSDFESNPTYRLAQNAVTQTTIDDVALNRAVVTSTDHTFSNKIDTWEVTNQKKSGRCWMFAALNLFRAGAMKKMNLENFEFSQNYTLFWDKLERSNYFLEAMIETADRHVDDRTVAWLLDRPLEDGGQWNMFINLVQKHGVVPKAFMPETESSSNTSKMNHAIIRQLRQGAKTLRDLRGNGAPIEAARAAKDDILRIIHRMLCIHLGTPPASFIWQWNDKDNNFHRDGTLTPQDFARKYIDLPLDDYVCLVNDPRPEHPYGRTYTVEYLGNVVGGRQVIYLNIDTNIMKQLAVKTIESGEPVWMGCDVNKMMRRDMGLWDADLFQFDAVYDADFTLHKADRLIYHESLMTHAMLFTGVDVIDGKPRRWRVENSWGEDNGRKGFYVMNDNWFDQYMFEIAVRKNLLPENLQRALETEPKVLPAWDPMGALAR